MRREQVLDASWALLGTGAGTALVAGLALSRWAGSRVMVSAALGAALATLLALSGIWLLAWTFDKSQKVFLAALVGGFLGRMVIFGLAVVLMVSATELPPAAFVGGLLMFYAVYQVVEIRAAHRLAGATGSGLESRR